MTQSDKQSMIKLVALHKHWLAADSVKQFMLSRVPTTGHQAFPADLLEIGQFFSASLRLGVFYGLLQVVVEGYRELKLKDPAIDQLLAQQSYADGLRRFRNATFHYQEDPLSPKLLEFLEAEDSEQWTQGLYRAFKGFFERALPIADTLNRYRRGEAGGDDSNA